MQQVSLLLNPHPVFGQDTVIGSKRTIRKTPLHQKHCFSSQRPDYGKQKPVTKADIAVFDAACSGYQYPLGTPLTVGKRKTTDSRDYKFTVKSRGMNGEDATSTIYVTVGKGKDSKPEFTEVVR